MDQVNGTVPSQLNGSHTAVVAYNKQVLNLIKNTTEARLPTSAALQ